MKYLELTEPRRQLPEHLRAVEAADEPIDWANYDWSQVTNKTDVDWEKVDKSVVNWANVPWRVINFGVVSGHDVDWDQLKMDKDLAPRMPIQPLARDAISASGINHERDIETNQGLIHVLGLLAADPNY